ncbi:MAG: hypothetical protein A2Z52_01475 [Candidatus Moranbacteria bacterium RBG_19FT_COMBO_42_6]|nr:MAG: hypothetical protein A2Z52_01475 [Candidatus Moranbacteria bacterium RBG_19FT_COMBO_42_6]
MRNRAPALDLETIRAFLPGWYDEIIRAGNLGRPNERVVFGRIYTKTRQVSAEGKPAKNFAYSVLKAHFVTMDTLTKLVLLEDGIAVYIKKHKEHPSKEDENEIRDLLGLDSAIGSV